MANNLFVSYDLIAPDKDYERVTKAVKELGNWAKVEYSLFYVNSSLDAKQAAEHVGRSMSGNDKLIVVDATNNQFFGYNITPEVLAQMQAEWYR